MSLATALQQAALDPDGSNFFQFPKMQGLFAHLFQKFQIFHVLQAF
jgi:hypothetical protein